MAERDNDLVGKAKSKFGEVATQAIAAAARQHRLDTERRVLADLRSQAFSLRAQVGEEMYKLWQAGSLPPSSLDHLFSAIDETMAAIAAQNERVDRLIAQRPDASGIQVTISQSNTGEDVLVNDDDAVEGSLAPPPVPAAPTRRLATGDDPCPTCGAENVTGTRFCGYCGSRLG